MKRLLKIGIILFGIGLLTGFGTYLYVFHKPHRNVAKEKPAYTLNADKLYNDFQTHEDSSYVKYGDKVIEVSGPVANVETTDNSASVTMLNDISGISFGFDSLDYKAAENKLKTINKGDTVTIKGQLDGYDMIMGVVLTRSVIIGKK